MQYSVDNPGPWSESQIFDGPTVQVGSRFLDDPTKFLHFKTPTLDTTLNRASYYRVFPFLKGLDTEVNRMKNYALMPDNMVEDGTMIMMLYPDLGEPQLAQIQPPEGLAICSYILAPYNQTWLSREPLKIGGQTRLQFNVIQFQTARFASEREMMHDLGFIRYKEIFLHLIEQTAYRLYHDFNLPIDYVSIDRDHRIDSIPTKRHIRSRLGGTVYPPEEMARMVDVELKRIRSQNELFARSNGYTSDIETATLRYALNYGGSAFAKPTADIVRDNTLQENFDSFFVRMQSEIYHYWNWHIPE